MKLSGHSYSNNTFDSLLDNIGGNVVYKPNKTAGQQSPINGMDMFSSTTEDTLRSIQGDQLRTIAAELQFAADKSKVQLNTKDLAEFAKMAVTEKLRGKKLERAASKFCNQLNRAVAPPQGTIRNSLSPSLLDTASQHAVVPAGYNVEHGQNDQRTGGYMGMSKNPNSIWDTEAMQRLAQTKFGDEQIKESRKAQEDFRLAQKKAFWQDLQNKMSSPDNRTEKAASVTTGAGLEQRSSNPKQAANSMSVFSDQRDFENIPQRTMGEMLKDHAEARSNKKASANETVKVALPERVSTRSAVDKLFDGLVDRMGS